LAQIRVDLGGALLKRTKSDEPIDVTQTLGPIGDVVDGVTNALPVDVAVDAPVLPTLKPRSKAIIEPVIQYG
jgi:hypothetical protein